MSDSAPERAPKPIDQQLDTCSYCPKMCRHACPVSTTSGKETWIPQVKMDRLNRLRLGQIPWTEENTEGLWACTGCRHCTVYCDHENEPAAVLFAGRAEALRRGVTHPTLKNYPERFAQRQTRLAEIAQNAFESDGKAGDVAFFPGCDALDKGASDVSAATAVFAQLGIKHLPVIAKPQACGGYPLLAAGHVDKFRAHAKEVASSLRGFKTVITNCSACRHAMKNQYAAEGVTMHADVVSVAEYLAKNAVKLTKPAHKKTVYYHDPCHLARSAGVTEEPRAVLRTVANLREFSWNRSDSECCGGGGLLPKTDPTTADAMAKRRLGEIHNQGGGTVVTACATCAFMLRRNAPASVEVMDLATAVATLCNIDYQEPTVIAQHDDD
jgi:dimethylglycine catabolism B